MGLSNPSGSGNLGRRRVVEVELQVDALGDLEGGGQRLGERGEDRPHLLAAAEIALVGARAQAVGLGHRALLLDEEEDLLRLGFGRRHVVHVVGGDQRQPHLARHVGELRDERLLVRDAVVLQFDVEAVAEDLLVAPGYLQRLPRTPGEQLPRDRPAHAGGERDQALGVLLHQLVVHARAIVETLEIAGGGEAHQVLEPGLVLSEQNEMVETARALDRLVEAAPPGDVRLHAEDRLHLDLDAGPIELDRPEEVASVGQGEGGHAERRRARDQPLDAGSAVEERVVRMDMKMDERVRQGLWFQG